MRRVSPLTFVREVVSPAAASAHQANWREFQSPSWPSARRRGARVSACDCEPSRAMAVKTPRHGPASASAKIKPLPRARTDAAHPELLQLRVECAHLKQELAGAQVSLEEGDRRVLQLEGEVAVLRAELEAMRATESGSTRGKRSLLDQIREANDALEAEMHGAVPSSPSPPALATPFFLPADGVCDFFLSHTQRDDAAKVLVSELWTGFKDMGKTCWLDVKMSACDMQACTGSHRCHCACRGRSHEYAAAL